MSARETLARMPLREKCAQRIFFEFRFAEPDFDAAMRLVKSLGAGGVVVRGGSRFDLAPFVNTLQKNAKVPLLVAADYARGAGREVDGATTFPSHLALRATGSEELARTKGRLTAREARALGVRWLLGGEGFEGDAALARAYAEGAAEMKVRTEPLPGALLAPADPEAALEAIAKDVEEGRLDDAELYRTVEGILQAKQALGLFGERITDQAAVERLVGAPSHLAAAEKIAEASILKLGEGGRVHYGDPRGLPERPDVCAWDDGEPSKRAAARALAGEIPFAGRWPFPEKA